MNFEEYYTYYLTLHKNKNNRRLHVLGQILTIFYVIMCLLNNPVFLIFAPFVVYPFAWTGHFYFEKNKPAAFSSPMYAKAADWVMFKDWIIGNLER